MATSLYIQPMTGTVHSQADCSTGTARYGTVPATDTAAADAYVADGRVKGCKTCYVAPANRPAERDETDPCQRGTVGCSVAHTGNTPCETW